MLRRFEDLKGFNPVPDTGGRYMVNIDGSVLDTKVGVLLSDNHDVEPSVHLTIDNENLSFKRKVLVGGVFKSLHLPISDWQRLDTVAVPTTPGRHPKDFVWKYPGDGLENPEGFYSIPGYSRYSISRAGIVYSHAVGRVLSFYTDALGYFMYGVTPDVGKRTIVGMHRLLALTFLPYTGDVDDCDVNHKDGVKCNNDLENLEWVSRKGNCQHAYSTGLRKDNVAVKVMNSFTREITEYYSFEECARQLDIDGETIRMRVKSAGKVIYFPGLQFKRSDDMADWVVYKNPSQMLKRIGIPIVLDVISKTTGERLHVAFLTDCLPYTKLKRGALIYHLRTHGFYENDHFRFERHVITKSTPSVMSGLKPDLIAGKC